MADVFGQIYSLSDPRAPEVPRYFGQTTQGLKRRFYGHVNEARRRSRRHVSRWVADLLREGLVPLIHLVSTAQTAEELDTHERAAITAGRAAGFSLCNITDGGEGKSGWVTSGETRAKMRQSALGRKPAPEWFVKMRGRKLSNEHRAKLVASHLGKKLSTDHVEKRRIAQAGLRRTGVALEKLLSARRRPDVRERMTAGQVLAWTDSGIRARRIVGMTLAQNRPDVKARKSSGAKASWNDPEVRARRTAALVAAWVRRREAA